MAERSYPSPRSGAAAGRSFPTFEVRGGGQEKLPRLRGQGQGLGPTIGINHFKRIPNGFPKDFPYPEYLLCKDYTCCCTLPPEELSRKDAIAQMAEKFHIMQPFNEFLKENILINIEEMESMKNVVKFV